jgi:anti-sigma factor ChrR (cupin superfamily)
VNAGTMPAGTVSDSIPDSTYVDIPSIPWTKMRFAGIEAKVLMENKATGMSTVLMRWAPGARLPQHEHVAIEQTYVIEGSFSDHDGTCTAGNYVWRKPGSRHDAWTDEGCLMLAFFIKPNTFFD